jgi:hypothetical protein
MQGGDFGGERKVRWQGRIVSIQPRIRLLRSFDERTHSYLGYVLGIEGSLDSGPAGTFLIALSEGAHEKHQFRHGDEVSGASVPVADPDLETAAYYRTSELEVRHAIAVTHLGSRKPPFHELAPPIEEYRARGHRRLDPRTYATKCATCIWGCRMPVEMIIDHWNRSRGPDNVRRRMETFCYGPEDCSLYKAGPLRKVPGRKGMVHEDDGDSRG